MAGNHAQTVMMATILTLTTSSQVSKLCLWCLLYSLSCVANWLFVWFIGQETS